MSSHFAESKKCVCIKSIGTFSKNKFVTVEIYLGSFNLVIFVSFNEKKLTRFDKKLKHSFYFFLIRSQKNNCLGPRDIYTTEVVVYKV